MSEFQPKRGDRLTLSAMERDLLNMKVLPTARQWMTDYTEGSSLWGHAKQTREHWGDL